MISVTTFLKAALITSASVSASTLRGNSSSDRRQLQAGYAFLVSDLTSNGRPWCIAATSGVSSGANLGFRLCDFDGQPANQLWQLDGDGRFHSFVDSNQCMIINFGTDIFDGVRVRMNSCNVATNAIQFSHNGSRDQITSQVDNSFCLTNRGVTPNAQDTIHAKPCQNQARYFFTYTPATNTPPPSTDFFEIKTDNGCLVYPGGNPTTGEGTMLGSCSGKRWRVESNGLIRTETNTDQCLQAGRGGTSGAGTKMRIYPCNANSSVQKFTIMADGKTQLEGTNLCVDHRGVNGDVGEDPIILKPCGNAGSWMLV